MSLDRIDRDPRKPSVLDRIHTLSAEQKSQEAEPQQLTETEPENYSSALDKMSDELLAKAMKMQESTYAEAETKLQITMLTEIIKEQHELLTAFLEDTKNTQIQMNDQTRSIIKQRMDTQDSKLQWILDSNKNLLNLQEIYKNEVRDHTVEIIRDLMDDVRDSIDLNFKDLNEGYDAAIKSAEERINKAADACNKSVAAANESAASLLRVSGVGTVLLVLSPLVAIADIIIRIVQMNM